MFKLNENYEVYRKILKQEYVRYLLAETSTINNHDSQIYINISREDSNISLLNSYLDLNFDVIERIDNSRHGNGNDIQLVNLRSIALFSSFKLTTSSGKHLEYNNHAHIVSLMCELISSSRGSDGLSICFDRDRNRRRNQLTNNEIIKGKYHFGIMLKDVFGFAEH